MKHYLICEAPICADERAYKDIPDWKKVVIWYPGEPVCGKKPFTKWQKRQAKINRWFAKGEFKHGDNYFFTVESLLAISSLRKERKGGNPDDKTR